MTTDEKRILDALIEVARLTEENKKLRESLQKLYDALAFTYMPLHFDKRILDAIKNAETVLGENK